MYQPNRDLAGEVCFRPNFFQTKARINYLIDEYLSLEELGDRLKDLPQQFENPQPRQWATINWQDINPEQVVGLELDVFLSIIKGASDTKAPIRDYIQTSRQYLEPIHPSMAKFIGGEVGENGKIIELGLWEKDERHDGSGTSRNKFGVSSRRHTPALAKIYQQLTNQKVILQFRTAKSYQAWENPYQDLYKHGLHRIATEYSAACLYLWLMSHTTGTIQQILAELLKDEVNHLVKFWGMGMWLYPHGAKQLIQYLLSQIHTILPISCEVSLQSQLNLNQRGGKETSPCPIELLKSTFQRMMSALDWQSWSILSRGELIYTFIWVLKPMWHWSSQLTPEYLQSCCATPEFFGNNNFEDECLEISIF